MSAHDERSGYRLNSPNVVARVIDGEAILIAFETGAYYSARGSGAWIVEGIRLGVPLSRIVEAFDAAQTYPRAVIESRVGDFLRNLEVEGLASRAASAPTTPEGGSFPQGLPFEEPTLEKFQDLEDLLLLDPIHDVDASGWPMAKERG